MQAASVGNNKAVCAIKTALLGKQGRCLGLLSGYLTSNFQEVTSWQRQRYKYIYSGSIAIIGHLFDNRTSAGWSDHPDRSETCGLQGLSGCYRGCGHER